jgi:hypothetical protein
MSTTGENHPLLPNTFFIAPLETWADAIQRLSSEAEQCFLEKIDHYKALSDVEHEFIIVYASHPSGSQIVLGADRNAQDLAAAASKPTSGSASQDTDTTQPSTVASSSGEESSHVAYDGVQVSHDGTPTPILAQHGPSVPLYTVTFSPTSPPLTPSTSTSSSNSDARGPPSLLHLSVLLITIRTHFPSYDLQSYFFAHVTCHALMDLFGGVETKPEKGKRAATARGVQVAAYSAGFTTLQRMIPAVASPVLQRMFPVVTLPALQGMSPVAASSVLPNMLVPALVSSPWFVVPAGVVVVGVGGYIAVKRCRRIVVKSTVDRLRIR